MVRLHYYRILLLSSYVLAYIVFGWFWLWHVLLIQCFYLLKFFLVCPCMAVNVSYEDSTLTKHNYTYIPTYLVPSAVIRPRVAVPGETNLPTQLTTDTTVA